MSDYGTMLDKSTIRFERLLPGPIERVWRYIVESDKRKQWLCAGDIGAGNGARVQMVFRNESLSSARDIPRPDRYRDMPDVPTFTGTVTRWDPPNAVTHTWDFGEEASEVSYELERVGDKVRLVLTHRRLDTSDTVLSVSAGWHTHLGILVDVLEGHEPKPFWKTHEAFAAEYEKRLGQ